MPSDKDTKGRPPGLSGQDLNRLRLAAKERGLPADLEPEELVKALASPPGEGEFARVVREMAKALDALDRVAEEKGRKI